MDDPKKKKVMSALWYEWSVPPLEVDESILREVLEFESGEPWDDKTPSAYAELYIDRVRT